jgi:hypothetical protein
MAGVSLHMQLTLTSQLHGSVSQKEQFFVTDQTPSTDVMIEKYFFLPEKHVLITYAFYL